MRGADEQVERVPVNGPEADSAAGLLPDNEREEFADQVNLAREACNPFDQQAYLEGHLTPVYWGSALRK